jgi:hypothetical protein
MPVASLGDRFAVEQPPTRGVDPATEHVPVRRDPEALREAPHQVRRRDVERAPRIRQRQATERVRVEEVTQVGGDLAGGPSDGRRAPFAEMRSQPRPDEGERRLCLEIPVRIRQGAVQGSESPDELRIAGVALLTLTIAIVVVASSAIWAVGGAAIGRLVDDERSHRAVGLVHASMLVASVALIWI